VYNLLLRSIWNPTGLQRVVDELLHVVIPVLYLCYYFIIANKTGLNRNNIFHWLIYPVAYVVFVLLRGIPSGFYPYPFLNVNALGYSRVLLNITGLFLAFSLLAMALIIVARLLKKKQRSGHAAKRALHLKQRKDPVRLKH
jgi:hypothetical protein